MPYLRLKVLFRIGGLTVARDQDNGQVFLRVGRTGRYRRLGRPRPASTAN